MPKYDCSKTVDFLHERKRLCTPTKDCIDCPIVQYCGSDVAADNAAECIQALQQWSDTHPEPEPETERNLVEVVRCRDCVKSAHTDINGSHADVNYCSRKFYSINPDDFCSYGVRRDGERDA